MRNTYFWLGVIGILILSLAVLTQNRVQDVNVPLTEINNDFDVYNLENGLTVTVKEMHSTPLVTIQFWVHVGGKNEPDEFRGIAHIFEHMWFKGTATQPVGSFDKRVESLGGQLNAMTSADWTMYFVTLPADKFDDIFPYMADLLLNPLFDENELAKEKEVVVEEQRFTFNEPERFIDQGFTKLLIDEHPYKHPVIGFKETIRAPEREDIIKFYNDWYVPNNMNIVIVGDVDKEEVLQKVKKEFGSLEAKPVPDFERPEQKPIEIPRYETSKKDVGYTYVALGHLGPKADEEDKYAMIVLNTIFSEGESSRIKGIVKKEKNLIVKGDSYYYPLNEAGAIEIIATIEPKKAGEAKAELIYQLNRFKTELVSEEEIEKAKTLIKAYHLRSQEQVFNVGFEIGNSWIDGDIEEYKEFITKIEEVTSEDVQAVAQKHFTAYTMYELKPKLI